MKNIIILNDFSWINGGSDKVSFDYYNELKEDDSFNVFFLSYYGNSNKNINEITPDFSINASKKINLLQHVFNVTPVFEIIKLKKKFHFSNTIFIVHTFTKGFSPSIFYFIKQYKTILIAHDYGIICPNISYFDFKKQQKCTLKPFSIKCMKESCCSSNSYLEKIGRICRGIIQKFVFYFHKKLIIVPVSNYSKQILNKFIKISDQPIYSVFNDIFQSSKATVPSTNNQIIYVGRIDYDKGILNLLKNVIPFFPDQKFVFIGDGNKKLIEEFSKFNNVTYMGFQHKKVIYEQIKLSKLLLFPTLWHETFSLVVYEAAKFGVPSVISINSAPTDIFKDKVSSFHYDFSSQLNIKYLRKIFYDKKLLDEVGSKAKLMLKNKNFNKKYNLNILFNYIK